MIRRPSISRRAWIISGIHLFVGILLVVAMLTGVAMNGYWGSHCHWMNMIVFLLFAWWFPTVLVGPVLGISVFLITPIHSFVLGVMIDKLLILIENWRKRRNLRHRGMPAAKTNTES